MPLHVQQAHFGVADAFLVFFTTGAVLFSTKLVEEGGIRAAAFAGVCSGLAVGCKAGAVLLALPLASALMLGVDSYRDRFWCTLAVGGAATIAFAVTNPYALVHFDQVIGNLADQAALVRGAAEAPYTLQYQGAVPYVYHIAQQLWWGMGPLLGGVSFVGLVVAGWDVTRRPMSGANWVGLAWALPSFAFTGGLFAKFPRYLLPLTPLLAVYGASLVQRLRDHLRWAGWTVGVLAGGTTAVLSLGLVLSYRLPHPWVAASEWLESRLQPGAVVVGEEWDHPLPVNGVEYDVRVLPIYDPDLPEKWEAIETSLLEAEVVVIASRRGYATLVGLEERFPHTAEYYRALLAGERGFQVVACFERWPRLGPVTVLDDPFTPINLQWPSTCNPTAPSLWLPRLDESFVVYDHPMTVILRRTD
jgi:hypothetical protein